MNPTQPAFGDLISALRLHFGQPQASNAGAIDPVRDLQAYRVNPYQYAGGGTVEVRAGDTLGGIAKSRGMSVEELAELNGIADPDKIKAGQVLSIRRKDTGPQTNLYPAGGGGEGEEPDDFNLAFKQARETLGPNATFTHKGRIFTTNLAGEKFEPAGETLDAAGLDRKKTRERVERENEEVESIYAGKETVKLEPEFKPWEQVKQRQAERNRMEQAEIITNYQAEKAPDQRYLVVDKGAARMHLYRGGDLVDSFEVGTAFNEGDEQTITRYRLNSEGERIPDGKGDYQVDWEAGNKQTGAGRYEIAGRGTYDGYPSFYMRNEKGTLIPTAIHRALRSREKYFGDGNAENNRMSYGCVNAQCTDLKKLAEEYDVDAGTPVFILPDNPEENRFRIRNGALVMDSENPHVNNSNSRSLNYIPIEFDFDQEKFVKEKFTRFDRDDEQELQETVIPFMDELEKAKRDVMRVARVDGDVYNEIAQTAFGIFGAESNFGDTHSPLVNAARAIRKGVVEWWYEDENGKKTVQVSGPDTQSESGIHRMKTQAKNLVGGVLGWDPLDADEEVASSSVGLTQLRWNAVNDQEKEVLKELGITGPEDFNDPRKAARGTAAILAIRYRNEIPNTQKETGDFHDKLSLTWNRDEDYPTRVREAQRFTTLTQLD